MRIVVVGASGGSGRAVVDLALQRGHRVTAVVRDPAGAGFAAHEGLDVVRADALDPASLAPHLKGADAVVTALGHRGSPRDEQRICTDGAASAVEAMAATGVGRIVAISAATVTTQGDTFFTRVAVKPILRRVFRGARADSIGMERVLAGSGADWVVVRPPMLTDTPATGRFRTVRGANPRGGMKISRADLAHAVLDAAADPTVSKVAIGAAY
jgi:uncharacterized protein YbjT (DUF2867 family)